MQARSRRTFRAAWAVVLLLAAPAVAGCLGPKPEPVSHTDGDTPGVAAGPLPPVPDFVWTPSRPLAGQTVQFLDRSTDPDDAIAKRTWKLPDSSTLEGDRASFTFRDAGTFGIRLTVQDASGLNASLDKQVVVLPLNGTPLDGSGSLPSGPRSHVVVALVDTGINPYHDLYRSAPLGDPGAMLEGYPVDAKPLALTLGSDYGADRKADETLWGKTELNQLYYFPGTRIVGGISFGHDSFSNSAANDIPVLDEDGHGTATSSRVAMMAPDAWIVMVEAGASSLEDAIAWAANQPWIDVISISIGPLADLPTSQEGDPGTHAAWGAGKIVFTAAGNEPTLSPTSPLSGPVWVVSVGAALPDKGGEPGTAAKGMDIVSDYDPETADFDSVNGTQPRSGTSFSTPTAAGVVAEALYLARDAAGWSRGLADGKLVGGNGPGLLADGLTNAELRDAMNGVAVYWDVTRWGPSGLSLPILPVAPWVQMGWGYVGPDEVATLSQVLLSGTVPTKGPDAQAYMGAVMSLRESLWGPA